MSQYSLKMSGIIAVGILSTFLTGPVQADDLLQVYQQALYNDPAFKQAQSTWWSAKQNLPIAVSAMLPQATVTDLFERFYIKNRPASMVADVVTDGYRTINQVNLSASQALFDYGVWTNIAEQSAAVKAATATYLAAIQAEIASTATAYFNVLAAYDQLRFTIANKEAVKRQWITAEQKFKVGLIAITGVYNAEASYDQAVATEIADRNNLYDQLENLRAITGQRYLSLKGINVQVPLITPAPDDINVWVDTAVRQNYTLQADNYSAISSYKTIMNVATTGFVPTIDAVATWQRTNNFNYSHNIPGISNSWTNIADMGLSLSWNPFSGGQTYFSTKQARYNYLTALGVLEQQHRSVVNQTRQSFVSVKSSISRIQADKQSIISARNALEATEAGYTVGTRTMVDVLDALTQVYSSENQYMDDQYTYLNSFISLKQQAGTLSMDDLVLLNSWLKKNVVFPLPKGYYGSSSVSDDQIVMQKLDELTRTTPVKVPDDSYYRHIPLTVPGMKPSAPDTHSTTPIDALNVLHAPASTGTTPAPLKTLPQPG